MSIIEMTISKTLNKNVSKAFALDPAEIDNWYQALPHEYSPLYWCLRNNKIEPEKYFFWAQRFYNLPTISSNFFRRPPNKLLWQKLKNKYPWSKECVPVTESCGVIFIGCLEPPGRLRLPFPYRTVLAKLDDLEHWWQKLKETEKSDYEVHDDEQTITKQIEPLKELPAKPIAQAINQPQLAELFEINSAALSDNPPTETTNITSVIPVEESTASDITPIAVEEKPQIKTPPPLPPPELPTHVGIAEFIAINKQSLDISYFVAELFEKLTPHYEQTMLAYIQDMLVHPVFWNNKWYPKTGFPHRNCQLHNPSIFQIVVNSKAPYHGYIMPNETNNRFFDYWNRTATPEYITIYPLLLGTEVKMIFLGTGKNDLPIKKSLDLMAQISTEFYNFLLNSPLT